LGRSGESTEISIRDCSRGSKFVDCPSPHYVIRELPALSDKHRNRAHQMLTFSLRFRG